VIVEDVRVQVISARRPERIHPFTGLEPAHFRRLVRLVAQRGGEAIADVRPGRQGALDLADRVLLGGRVLAHVDAHAIDPASARHGHDGSAGLASCGDNIRPEVGDATYDPPTSSSLRF